MFGDCQNIQEIGDEGKASFRDKSRTKFNAVLYYYLVMPLFVVNGDILAIDVGHKFTRFVCI